MAIEAKLLGRFTELGIVPGSVRIVASKTRNAAAIHQALHKIVALHPVLVRGAVRKMGECGLSKRVFLEAPKVAKMQAHTIPDRPIVVFAVHGIVNRAPPANGTGCTLRWHRHS